MVGTEMGFKTKFNIFQKELYNAFLILIGERGEKGVLDIKGLGITFDGVPIASVKINRGSLLFVTDNEEFYGFFSESLKDMCRLYDDITEVFE